jgi:hypothetical protein
MLLDIAHERNGYSIGKPWRFTEHSLAAVVPLVRETKEDRIYRLFSERKDDVKVVDKGNIDQLIITNDGKFPVLIKAGEVLTGSTQSRTITISQIIFPGDKVPVSCACVYSTKGIREGQRMVPGFYSPTNVRREIYKGHYQMGKLSPSGYSRRQSEIWHAVSSTGKQYASKVENLVRYASAPNAIIGPGWSSGGLLEDIDTHYDNPSEDLAGRVEETQEKLKDIIKSIPETDFQVGIVLLTMSGLESMEAFEHPDSWEGLRRSILGAESAKIVDVSDQAGLFEFKASKAKEVVKGLLTKSFSEKKVVDREKTQTYILDTDKFMGEVVLLDKTPIHCSFVKKES